MRVVCIAAECEPWAKTGGLGDVVDALARAVGPTGKVAVEMDAASSYTIRSAQQNALEWSGGPATDGPWGDSSADGSTHWLALFTDTDGNDFTASQPSQIVSLIGTVEPIYVGDVVIGGGTKRELLLGGCAVGEITAWCYDDGSTKTWNTGEGTDLFVPRYAGWTALGFSTPYRDIIGADGVTYRRTVMYMDGARGDAIAAGTAHLTVDLDGIEDVGDGSGETITDLYLQIVHALNYFVLRSYTSGPWPSPLMFPGTSICQVNRPSFTALSIQRKLEIPGGYVGAWILGAAGERTSVQAWIARWAVSGACRIGPNGFWQTMAWAIDPTLVASAYATVIDIHDVAIDAGDPQPQYDQLWNVVPYTYGPPLNGGADWGGTAVLKHAASIANYGREFPAQQLELYCLRDATIAAAATAEFLRVSRAVPVLIEPEGDLRLLSFDHGDPLRYTQYRGLGSSGYIDRLFVVIGVTVTPMTRRVKLECLDVTDMLS